MELFDSMDIQRGRIIARVRRKWWRDADDIVQEVNMALWRAVLNYRPESGIFERFALRWMIGAVRLYFRNQLPKGHRGQNARRGMVDTVPLLATEDEELLEYDRPPASLDETDDALLRHLDAMTPRQAEIVDMVVFQGRTIKATAHELGLAKQGVSTTFRRGLERVRAAMADGNG